MADRERDFRIVNTDCNLVVNSRDKITNLVGLREYDGDFRKEIYSLNRVIKAVLSARALGKHFNERRTLRTVMSPAR